MADLGGLCIAVTGAGRGIGRSIALRLASAGAHLAVIDREADLAEAVRAEVAALGRPALAVRGDVTRAADCAELVRRTADGLGRLDVMVCNAGIVQVKPFLEITEEDWDATFAVNVKGTFLTMQAAAARMRAQKPLAAARPRGKIITMSSIAGRYGAGPMAPLTPHYRASKASVISLTQTAAYALAPDITVNAICPGLVETDMWRQIDQEWAAAEGWSEGEAWKRRTAVVPMGRPQTPDDVAGLARYLCSPDSDYMTGQALNIDGGLIMS
ncbi:SDR family NAD(P)-dependent oxidoreductase [Streptomyces sp. NPDC020845]|uniref:SDR family NAD(P)-dependent oxidoreductase n=1 Tax=Streptomyces sp. NPDC020845 TaxID=3365096 RepID=UPI00379C8816